MDPIKVIISNVQTEKSAALVAKGTYMLNVDAEATKVQIRQALKDLFGVDALSVNTLVRRGKVVRRMRVKKAPPVAVKLSNVKKAFVTLKQGQSLPVLIVDGAAETKVEG